MDLKNCRLWRLRPDVESMQWMMEEGFPGWPLSWMWEWIPAEALAEREAQVVVKAKNKVRPER